MEFDADQLAAVKRQGYIRLASVYGADQLSQLRVESEQLIERAYNQEELDRHSVYPSDSTETRVSHAFMLAEGESDFPSVTHQDLPMVSRFLTDHHRCLSQLTGREVAASSRSMLNYQNYLSGSKPVGEHFDGEYLRTRRAGDGIEFQLLEGILPRYVSVLILANDSENEGRGTELVNGETVYQPELNQGDIIWFDNIRMRHRVPTLSAPRTTIGLRNFDHFPLHFAADESHYLDGHYRAITEGWVSEDVDCEQRLAEFMTREWPQLKKEYAHYF